MPAAKTSRVPTNPADQLPLERPPVNAVALSGASTTAPTTAVTMRTPFPEHQISKLPKPTKQQTDEVRADYTKGIRCQLCGGWHHPKVVHLDYVGHAAITNRLLDVDPAWGWEPVSVGADGFPALDKEGGLWIRLTINGVTRLGYGDAPNKSGDKSGGDIMKERIGDAIRNAAMRFGAALELWHKGELHVAEDAEQEQPETAGSTMMPSKARVPVIPAPAGVQEAEAQPSQEEGTDDLAEPGERAFISTKLKLLKGAIHPSAIIAEADLGHLLTWDAEANALHGNLTKAGFLALRAALKGKK